ncbi:MAG: hypothetical protein FJW40_23450 [Acidobacteria bacterium]|nr:hypothetical protein [Acidobacteriota bacterium]
MTHSRLLLLLSALSLAARGDVVEQGPKDAKPSGLLAGVARADITPPVGIAHLNWGSQTHVEAAGVDPVGMYATALVLSDGKQKFAMVDLDALFVWDQEALLKRAAERTGIPAAHIRLAATHTHAAPNLTAGKGPLGIDFTPYQRMLRDYQAAASDKVIGAIMEAASHLQPAHLGARKGTGSININRRVRGGESRPPAVGRNPDGLVDRDLNVIRIDNAHGKPIAIIANFQCHGTVLAYENKLLSPDWPGMTRKVVEREFPGALCLYFQGAAGNQGPIEGFTGDAGVAHRLGRILGHEVAAIALQIETVRREPVFEGFVESTAFQAKQHWRVAGPRDATLRQARRRIEVPRRTYTPAEISEMQRAVADAQTKLDDAKRSGDPWKQHQAEARWRRFSDLLDQWKEPTNPAPLFVEVEVLRIGDIAIASMPGEPFAEIGLAVKRASPFPVTLFCGYSTGAGGDYMPIASEYPHGGYEVQRSPYNPGAADRVVEAINSLLFQVK